MAAPPLFATSLEPYHDRLSAAVDRVVRDGRYILGPEVEAFEREFAAYLGVRHCIGVANGTDALTIALRALGVGPGDEVVMPSFTFYATAEAALVAGATPVFCDIDLDSFCVTAETVKAALTPRTKAIVPVHLFGNVAPVPELRALGLPVLEDAAQAAGAELDGKARGSAGRRGHVLVLPVQEPALPGRRRRDRDRRRRASPSRPASCASTARRTRPPSPRWATTPGSTPSRRPCCASCCPSSTAGTSAAARRRPPTSARASGRTCPCRGPRRAPATSTTSTWCARSASCRGAATTACPCTASRPSPPDVDLPATEEAARTNYALPMGIDLSDEQVRAVCASGST